MCLCCVSMPATPFALTRRSPPLMQILNALGAIGFAYGFVQVFFEVQDTIRCVRAEWFFFNAKGVVSRVSFAGCCSFVLGCLGVLRTGHPCSLCV